MTSRVVVFGYGELAIAGLEALRVAGAQVIAVVTPSNRHGADVAVVGRWSERHGIVHLQQPPRAAIAPFVESLRRLAPELLVVCSYSMRLPPSVLAVPSRGAVNVHGGPLPEYRGGHVAQWAILNGEREFGVTLHDLDEELDTGAVIAEQRFELGEHDDAGMLRERIRQATVDLLVRWWPRIADGSAPRQPQDESRARYWPLRTPEQGAIDWRASAAAIARLVRALCANDPGAYIEVCGRRMSIRAAAASPAARYGTAPGIVTAVEADGVRVATGDGELLIRVADIDGQPATSDAVAALLAAGVSERREL